MSPNISVIIPTLNEVDYLPELIRYFRDSPDSGNFQVIVVDGGSVDGTLEILKHETIRLITSSVASRAVQMNLGAKEAQHDLLYFLHADVIPPVTLRDDLIKASEVFDLGGYRFRFDSKNPLLKVNAFFTRFPMLWCRGGDQSMFVSRDIFEKLGGFDERFCVMEDYDFIERASVSTRYHIIPKSVTVSARKYRNNGYFKVMWANLMAFRRYKRGLKPATIQHFYKKALS